MSAPADTRAPRGPSIAMTIAVMVMFFILSSLGFWQVQRLKWKTHLLAQIAQLQHAPAQAIDAPLFLASHGADVGFTRVSILCPGLETAPTVRLYAVNDAGPGYRVITACRLASGPYDSILVDRGFLTMDQAATPLPMGQLIVAPIVGVLRTPDRKTFVTPPNQANLWYWRDVSGMAAALHATRPAPLFLMLESPAPSGGLPAPAPVPLNIPNNHLGYAVTWFGLAAALAGVYLAMLFRGRRS